MDACLIKRRVEFQASAEQLDRIIDKINPAQGRTRTESAKLAGHSGRHCFEGYKFGAGDVAKTTLIKK